MNARGLIGSTARVSWLLWPLPPPLSAALPAGDPGRPPHPPHAPAHSKGCALVQPAPCWVQAGGWRALGGRAVVPPPLRAALPAGCPGDMGVYPPQPLCVRLGRSRCERSLPDVACVRAQPWSPASPCLGCSAACHSTCTRVRAAGHVTGPDALDGGPGPALSPCFAGQPGNAATRGACCPAMSGHLMPSMLSLISCSGPAMAPDSDQLRRRGHQVP